MTTVIAFALLAMAGGVARWIIRPAGRGPAVSALGTLTVNLIGAFALGVVIARGSDPVVTAVGVGGLGAFTTYSTLVGDTVALVDAGRWRLATAYLTGTIAVGIGLADLGLRLA